MRGESFRDAVRSMGVVVGGEAGWATHNRDPEHGAWGPVNGVMIHHSVTKGARHTIDICHDGYEDLPGPLCHGTIMKDGGLHLVGWGRANHAGLGDPDVLAAVVREDSKLPAPQHNTADGNVHFYGFECENLGDNKDQWTPAQVDTVAVVSAVLCRWHGWSERSVIGHLEWQKGKVDPRGPISNGSKVSMASFRLTTGSVLHAGESSPTMKRVRARKH